MSYLVRVVFGPKQGILNPEAIAIKKVLEERLGFEGIEKFDIRKSFYYTTNQKTRRLAKKEAKRLCEAYFVNLSVNEEYKIISVRKIK